MSSFPEVPFSANLSSGAHAQSSSGVDWGEVFRQFKEEQVFTVVSLFDGRAKINDPLWDGTKVFWVDQGYVVPVVVTPPPTGGDGPAQIIIPDHIVAITDEQGNALGTYKADAVVYNKVG